VGERTLLGLVGGSVGERMLLSSFGNGGFVGVVRPGGVFGTDGKSRGPNRFVVGIEVPDDSCRERRRSAIEPPDLVIGPSGGVEDLGSKAFSLPSTAVNFCPSSFPSASRNSLISLDNTPCPPAVFSFKCSGDAIVFLTRWAALA
jgi:hypothetical protein